MEAAVRRVVGKRLNNPDREAVFSLAKLKNLFTLRARMLLFPLENFFNGRMPDNRDSLIILEEPLNYVRNRIHIDLAGCVSLQRRKVYLVSAGHISRLHRKAASTGTMPVSRPPNLRVDFSLERTHILTSPRATHLAALPVDATIR